jgi:hypothetical protein
VRKLASRDWKKSDERLDEPSSQQLYTLRVVEVLEGIASPETRQRLDTLAGSLPDTRLTREAQASLSRLNRRAPAFP